MVELKSENCRAILFDGGTQIAVFGSGKELNHAQFEWRFSYLHLRSNTVQLNSGFYPVDASNPPQLDVRDFNPQVDHQLVSTVLNFNPADRQPLLTLAASNLMYDGDGDLTVTLTNGGVIQLPPINIPVTIIP